MANMEHIVRILPTHLELPKQLAWLALFWCLVGDSRLCALGIDSIW